MSNLEIIFVLRALDIEKSRSFYELLGLSFTEEKHGDGPRHYATEVNNTVIELYPATQKNPVDKVQLVIYVPDYDATMQALRAAGYSPISTTGVSEHAFLDPDGRAVLIYQSEGDQS